MRRRLAPLSLPHSLAAGVASVALPPRGLGVRGAVNGRLLLAVGVVLCVYALPASAKAYVECGNPRGPARNVTATNLGCGDARAFARKFAVRRITRSRWISLPGWHSYYARVRRVFGGYDVRATRANKVIHFGYLAGGGSGRRCDPNYRGVCLRPNVSDYDCAGGSGNGPYYTGRVIVVGNDHYGLDADGDGIGCE